MKNHDEKVQVMLSLAIQCAFPEVAPSSVAKNNGISIGIDLTPPLNATGSFPIGSNLFETCHVSVASGKFGNNNIISAS